MISSTLQAGMTANFRVCHVILAITLFGFSTLPTYAQQLQ